MLIGVIYLQLPVDYVGLHEMMIGCLKQNSPYIAGQYLVPVDNCPFKLAMLDLVSLPLTFSLVTYVGGGTFTTVPVFAKLGIWNECAIHVMLSFS